MPAQGRRQSRADLEKDEAPLSAAVPGVERWTAHLAFFPLQTSSNAAVMLDSRKRNRERLGQLQMEAFVPLTQKRVLWYLNAETGGSGGGGARQGEAGVSRGGLVGRVPRSWPRGRGPKRAPGD